MARWERPAWIEFAQRLGDGEGNSARYSASRGNWPDSRA